MKKLNKGQLELYKLICRTLAEGKMLELNDYLPIYIEFVEREPEYLTCDGPKRKYARWVQFNASQWVIRNIGILVQKEYLKVVPQVKR